MSKGNQKAPGSGGSSTQASTDQRNAKQDNPGGQAPKLPQPSYIQLLNLNGNMGVKAGNKYGYDGTFNKTSSMDKANNWSMCVNVGG